MEEVKNDSRIWGIEQLVWDTLLCPLPETEKTVDGQFFSSDVWTVLDIEIQVEMSSRQLDIWVLCSQEKSIREYEFWS